MAAVFDEVEVEDDQQVAHHDGQVVGNIISFQASLGDDYPDCPAQVSAGSIVTISLVGKDNTEKFCRNIRSNHKLPVDWEFLDGRIAVKTAAGDVGLAKAAWLEELRLYKIDEEKERLYRVRQITKMGGTHQ